MTGQEFHQKYLRKEIDFPLLIQSVYNGNINELDNDELLVVAAFAAKLVSEAADKYIKDIKRCIVCGTPHSHNNAFCCPEHKEVYDMQRKNKHD